MRPSQILAAVAAFAAISHAELLIQIGTKADQSNIYKSRATKNILSRLPQGDVDMAALEGATPIDSLRFQIGEDRYHRYYDYDGYESRTDIGFSLSKPMDAGLVTLLGYMDTDHRLPLVTVADISLDRFVIYSFKNVTVKSSSVDFWKPETERVVSVSNGDIQMACSMVSIESGSSEATESTFHYERPQIEVNAEQIISADSELRAQKERWV